MVNETRPQGAKVPVSAPYNVGYGKPPPAKRFHKGKSGNPNGRPKGSKNIPDRKLTKLRDIILAEAVREVTVQDKSGPISMPVAQAAVRSLALKAAQGSVGAQKLFLESVNMAEANAKIEQDQATEEIYNFKRRARERIQYYQMLGEPLPDEFWPDPDHINLDFRTGEIMITGPMDIREKRDWDAYWHDKGMWQERLNRVLGLLDQVGLSDENAIETIGSNVEVLIYILALFEAVIILRWRRRLEEVVDNLGRYDHVLGFVNHVRQHGKPPPEPDDYLGWW